MSDADYAAFLDKANQDPNEGHATATSKSKEFKAQDKGVEVPKAIQDVLKQDKVYISDADEPFVGVALQWDEAGKGLPDEGELCRACCLLPSSRQGRGNMRATYARQSD